ncbi:MAG: DNA polymerase III subunit epsilon [Gammaproteobacteria bacterium]
MRQIVLDTETTGLEIKEGHRVIEIGGIELLNRRPTGRTLHHYLQPDRDIDEGAAAVHGITAEFLEGKPRFADVASEWLAFLTGAELIIHNADFDIGFIDNELSLVDSNHPGLRSLCGVLDTLRLARELHPGQHNNLDALCRRYAVDNTHRTVHGALLDAEILADLYRAMTGGQVKLDLMTRSSEAPRIAAIKRDGEPSSRQLKVIRATDDELAEHERRLDAMEKASGAPCVWRSGDKTDLH